ncbi:hypothetical protein ACHAWF_017262 [Thalassiosira exigua]
MARPTVASMSPGILAAIAFVLSLFAGVYCKFISFTSTGENPITLYFGIWYYQGWSAVENPVQGTVILESCLNYPDGTNLDSKWRSAMAFSAMTLIIGGVVTFWALLAGCLYPSRGTYKAGGGLYMLCCLFQGLSLLLLNSNACHNNNLLGMVQKQVPDASLAFPSSCSMAYGAKCAIAATVMWFVTAIAAITVEPPQRGPVTVQTHDVTYTRTTGADGTTMVTENVVKGQPVPVGGEEKTEEQPLLEQEYF